MDEIFSLLCLRMVYFCLQSCTFYIQFIQYLPAWIRFGSGPTTLVPLYDVLALYKPKFEIDLCIGALGAGFLSEWTSGVRLSLVGNWRLLQGIFSYLPTCRVQVKGSCLVNVRFFYGGRSRSEPKS